MGLGATNKRKGSNAERYYVKIFKELGFEFCCTARFASKKHDNAKIDLLYVPFNIQIKAGIQKGLNPGKELFYLESSIKTMFPVEDEVHTKPCLLIHNKQGTLGRKRLPEDDMVFMSYQQYLSFNEHAETNLTFTYQKQFKFDMASQFKHIVGMSFEHFKTEVIIKQYQQL
jgi:hypothetical protein